MPFWSGLTAGTETTQGYDQEELTTESFLDGTSPLRGTLLMPVGKRDLPCVVLVPEYGDSREVLLPSARRLTEKGVAALVVDLRGSGDSGGSTDAGGREIGDVLDLLRIAEAEMFDRLDMSRLGILGYGIHGGATALALVVRAPMTFRSIAVFSGVPNLSTWAERERKAGDWVRQAVDGKPETSAAVRNNRAAIGNARQTKMHLFWDAGDEGGIAELNRDFLRSTEKRRMPNVEGHESRPGGLLRWKAGYPETNPMLATAEDFVLSELRSESSSPRLPVKGRLRVPGFLVTPLFTVVPGDGDTEVVDLAYSLESSLVELDFGDTEPELTGWIEVDTADFEFPLEVRQGDRVIATFDKPAARIRLEERPLSGVIRIGSAS